MKIIYTNVDGSYPDIKAKNSTSTDAKDGTPLNKDLFDEYFGVLQAATSQGGITPSGSSDLHDESDVINGIRNISGSPGEIVYKVSYDSADAILRGERLLLLSGTTVLVSNYELLTEYAYCGDSANNAASGFFRCNNSDGSGRSTTGTYLYLPDYRGYFIRCAGGNLNGVDPSTRAPHSAQDDGIKDHKHYITDDTGPATYYMVNLPQNFVGTTSKSQKWSNAADDTYFADESPDTNADETRPVNRNTYAYVRY